MKITKANEKYEKIYDIQPSKRFFYSNSGYTMLKQKKLAAKAKEKAAQIDAALALIEEAQEQRALQTLQ